jgi:hypothetical protein
MKMRHFWRWPVLCSMLFGLAAAGSAATATSALPAAGAVSPSTGMAPRLAHDARLHARMSAIRAALQEARHAQQRPAALRGLAAAVEIEAEGMVEESFAGTAAGRTLEAIVADLYTAADDLRHASKAVRSTGLARLDGALREYGRQFEQHYETTA